MLKGLSSTMRISEGLSQLHCLRELNKVEKAMFVFEGMHLNLESSS